MTTPHTNALDHALAEALSRASEPYAEEVDISPTDYADDGTPTEYAVVVWRDGTHYAALAATADDALTNAMTALHTAMGGTR